MSRFKHMHEYQCHHAIARMSFEEEKKMER